MKAVASILCACLVACTTDPNAGMVAARQSGAAHYLAFTRNGQPDSAAVFPFLGRWMVYHPSLGASIDTLVPTTKPAPMWVHAWLDGVEGSAHWVGVTPGPMDEAQPYGCLPYALASLREHGGALVITQNHVENEY